MRGNRQPLPLWAWDALLDDSQEAEYMFEIQESRRNVQQ